MSFIDFMQLKKSVPIESVLSELGLACNFANGQWRGPCPICQSGGKRALVVTPAKSAFYCFGGRIGGDVIALTAHIKSCSMKDAAMLLASKAGLTPSPSTVPEERKKEAARSLQPLDYLETDHQLVTSLGLTPETCALFEAGYAPKGIMRGRLAIPIHTMDGELAAYCGATGDRTEPLKFPKGFKPELYLFGINQVDGKNITLVQEPLDVLLAAQNGINAPVSFLTETISVDQLMFLSQAMQHLNVENIEFA